MTVMGTIPPRRSAHNIIATDQENIPLNVMNVTVEGTGFDVFIPAI